MKKFFFLAISFIAALGAYAQEYTPVAYIQSVSAAKENVYELPYTPVTETKVDIKFKAIGGSGWRGIFSARNVGAGTGMSLYINGNNANLGYFTGATTGNGDSRAPFDPALEYECTCTVDKLIANGEEYPTGETKCNPTSRNFTLFANPEKDEPFRGYISYFKISEGETVLYDFQPVVRRSDGAFGYYDSESDTFVEPKNGYAGYTYERLEGQHYVYYEVPQITINEGATCSAVPSSTGAETPTYTYEVEDETVATVAADGTLSALKDGTTVVTATSSTGWTVKLTVNVVNTSRTTYSPVEYIDFNGKNEGQKYYYNTQYVPTQDTNFELKFRGYEKSKGAWRAVFSGRNSADNGISLYLNGNGTKFGFFSGGFIEDNFMDYVAEQDYEATVEWDNLTLEGVDARGTEYVGEYKASTNPVWLFSGQQDWPFYGRIYYFNINEGKEAKHKYVPVLRHDGVVGFYDEVTETFMSPNNQAGFGVGLTEGQKYVYYPAEVRNIWKGETIQILPEVQGYNDVKYLGWKVSDETIASVDEDGTVTGIDGGNVVVSAQVEADGELWEVRYDLQVSMANHYDTNGVGYIAIAGGNGYNENESWNKATDNDVTTKFGCGGAEDAWIMFEATEPVALKQYSLVTANDTHKFDARNPRSWRIQGSNNKKAWEDIDVRIDDHTLSLNNYDEFVFTVNSEVKYKYFKYVSDKLCSGFQLSEVWLNEKAHEWGEPKVTESTCTKAGTSITECTDCHVQKTEILPLKEHNYVAGACEVCHASVLQKTVLANGQNYPYSVKAYNFKGEQTEDGWYFEHELGTDWMNLGYEPGEGWVDVTMPIASPEFSQDKNPNYNSRWYDEHNAFLVRRPFTVDEVSDEGVYKLRLLHDDNVEVYLNGEMIFAAEGWTTGTGWKEEIIDNGLFQEGENMLAIYIQQNTGGAYLDCEITLLDQKKGVALTSPYQGVNADDLEEGYYYLYNPQTGLFLGDNQTNTAYWTSHAELGTRGMEFYVERWGSDVVFSSFMGNNSSLNKNLWLDTADQPCQWTPMETVDTGIENGYNLLDAETYMKKIGAKYSETNGSIGLEATSDALEYDTWQFVTPEERLEVALKNGASNENRVDLSWMVVGGTFPVADMRRDSEIWILDGTENQSNGGDGHFHNNRVQEFWGIGKKEELSEDDILNGVEARTIPFEYSTVVGDEEDGWLNLSLPAGRYVVSANAIYSPTGNPGVGSQHYNAYLAEEEKTEGVIFANDNETLMANIYELVADEKADDYNTKDVNGVWAYNGVNEFSNNIFTYDAGRVEVVVDIEEGETINLGARVANGTGESWVVIDDFRLVYTGTDTNGIKDVTSNAVNSKVKGIYTLNGMKVGDAKQKGIYIVNGKKVVK